MHPELIKARIRMQGTTPAALADELGRSRVAVGHVIHGRTRTPDIRQKISEVTGIPVIELWPDDPKPGLWRRKKKTRARRAHAGRGTRGRA